MRQEAADCITELVAPTPSPPRSVLARASHTTGVHSPRLQGDQVATFWGVGEMVRELQVSACLFIGSVVGAAGEKGARAQEQEVLPLLPQPSAQLELI